MTFFTSHSYAPLKFSQLSWAAAWFAVGYLIANIIGAVLILTFKDSIDLQIVQMIIYPLMFMPVFVYIGNTSRNNSVWEAPVPMDRDRFGFGRGILIGLLLCIATFAAAFVGDATGLLLPPMSEEMKIAMEALIGGNVLVSFICASVMAPIFEEWFCRGVVLRGLLVFKRENGKRGAGPVVAIVVSSLVFALIHGNIWQGVPAFLFGLLFGYVYYRTGSLKLTMLMHFFNNTLAIVMSELEIGDSAETWYDVLPHNIYWVLVAASVIIIALTVIRIRKSCEPAIWGNDAELLNS